MRSARLPFGGSKTRFALSANDGSETVVSTSLPTSYNLGVVRFPLLTKSLPTVKPASLKFHGSQGCGSTRRSSPVGKAVNKTQGETVALEMVERHPDRPAAMLMLLKFIEAHEARQAAREALEGQVAANDPA
jgi:hypothetical protein